MQVLCQTFCSPEVGDAEHDRVGTEIVAAVNKGEASLVDVVDMLGPYLTNPRGLLRARGTLLLVKLLEECRPSSPEQASFLVTFFRDRSRDAACVGEVVRGMKALLERWPIGAQGAEGLVTSLFAEVHVPSQDQGTRAAVYALLREALSGPCGAALQNLGHDFAFGCLQAVDGERDPRSLLEAFALTRAVVSLVPGWQRFLEDLFDVTSCYYPVSYRSKQGDSISSEALSASLEDTLTCTPLFAPLLFPFLFEKLEEGAAGGSSKADQAFSKTRMPVYLTLGRACERFGPHLFAPHASRLWRCLSADVFGGGGASIEEAGTIAKVLVEGLLAAGVSEGADGLLGPLLGHAVQLVMHERGVAGEAAASLLRGAAQGGAGDKVGMSLIPLFQAGAWNMHEASHRAFYVASECGVRLPKAAARAMLDNGLQGVRSAKQMVAWEAAALGVVRSGTKEFLAEVLQVAAWGGPALQTLCKQYPAEAAQAAGSFQGSALKSACSAHPLILASAWSILPEESLAGAATEAFQAVQNMDPTEKDAIARKILESVLQSELPGLRSFVREVVAAMSLAGQSGLDSLLGRAMLSNRDAAYGLLQSLRPSLPLVDNSIVQNLLLEDRNEGAWMALGNLINKDLVGGGNAMVGECVARFANVPRALGWLARGQILTLGDSPALSALLRLQDSEETGNAVRVAFSVGQDRELGPATNAVVRPLARQKAWVRLLPALQDRAFALAFVLPCIPPSVLSNDATSVLLALLKSLEASSSSPEALSGILGGLACLAASASDALAIHCDSLLPKAAKLAQSHPEPRVRLAALSLLRAAAMHVAYSKLFPTRDTVIENVRIALDDPFRDVRKLAVEVSNRFQTLG